MDVVYGLFVLLVFLYFLIRVWILHSRRTSVIIAGIGLVAVFGFPMLRLPVLASSLTVIGLAIVLLLFDRYQTTRSAGMWATV